MSTTTPSNTPLPFDFTWSLEFFEKRGKEQFGPNFRIYPEDHEIIYKLLVYFLRNEQEATRLGLDLNKGILLTGPIGCGKTKLMTLMRLVPAQDRFFVLKACRDISFEFGTKGFPVIDSYSTYSFRNNNQPRIYCFDDLGPEQTIKYYGNDCNIMAEIILSRYDQFISCGMLTHVTTNLSATEMDILYGNRVRSRLREMMNLVSFPIESKDKRK